MKVLQELSNAFSGNLSLPVASLSNSNTIKNSIGPGTLVTLLTKVSVQYPPPVVVVIVYTVLESSSVLVSFSRTHPFLLLVTIGEIPPLVHRVVFTRTKVPHRKSSRISICKSRMELQLEQNSWNYFGVDYFFFFTFVGWRRIHSPKHFLLSFNTLESQLHNSTIG